MHYLSILVKDAKQNFSTKLHLSQLESRNIVCNQKYQKHCFITFISPHVLFLFFYSFLSIFLYLPLSPLVPFLFCIFYSFPFYSLQYINFDLFWVCSISLLGFWLCLLQVECLFVHNIGEVAGLCNRLNILFSDCLLQGSSLLLLDEWICLAYQNIHADCKIFNNAWRFCYRFIDCYNRNMKLLFFQVS